VERNTGGHGDDGATERWMTSDDVMPTKNVEINRNMS
jgi:hypothetical protein